MAGFRPNSEIIGKFRKMGKFYDQFVKHQKLPQQTNFECVGVFHSRDIAICNLKTLERANYP